MTQDESKSGDSQAATPPKASEAGPYELAPSEPPAPASRPGVTPPKGGIDRPGLLTDFDEDADFDRDPEVEQARKAGGRAELPVGRPISRSPDGSKSGAAESSPESSEFGQPIVTPGRGTLKTILIVGATLAFAAALAGAINAAPGRSPFFVALSLLFEVAVHTVTGVGAVGLAAAMLGKLLRNTELAGARMLVATSLFALGFQLDFQSPAHSLGIMIASGLYFLAVWFLFKIKAKDAVVVAAFHFALWILFYLHFQVSVWALPASKAAQAVAPAAGAGG